MNYQSCNLALSKELIASCVYPLTVKLQKFISIKRIDRTEGDKAKVRIKRG